MRRTGRDRRAGALVFFLSKLKAPASDRQCGAGRGVRDGGLHSRAVCSRGLLPALLGSTLLIAASAAQAADATWSETPGSNDLTADANWDTGATPWVFEIASFGPSTITTLTQPGLFWVGGITLNADAANYTINNSDRIWVYGAGIIVNGGALTINNSGIMLFYYSSTAGSATIVTKSGAVTNFLQSSSGGTSRQIIEAGGVVDITYLDTGATALGSIEGAGTVKAGTYTLTVGTNDLSTTFSGDILGSTARLVKVGTGTLTLTGSSSTYLGNTTVNGGTLAVNGSLTNSSGIIVNDTGTLGGTGTVRPSRSTMAVRWRPAIRLARSTSMAMSPSMPGRPTMSKSRRRPPTRRWRRAPPR